MSTHNPAKKCSHGTSLKAWWQIREKLVVTTLSGILILIGWLGKYAGIPQEVSNWLMIIATVVAGYRIASSALLALRYKVLGINA